VHVRLVGDRSRLEHALREFPGWDELPLSIHHAPDTITMEDSPSKAVRAKPEASMPVAFDLVRQGEADAVMSAGNSGAMLACGLFKYRRIKGVDRPALVTSLPTVTGGMVTFLDVGANIECRPVNLVQWAVLGAVYAAFKHDSGRPRVGVLSNGTEESKGTDLTRVVHRILCDHPSDDFAYTGYAEGDDLFSGELDVVVTDGFTGNVALKVAEATGRMIGRWLKGAVTQGVVAKAGALLLRPAFSELKVMLDPDNYGAAPLLGVGGVAFICHGSASARAIGTSLQFAARSVTEDLIPKLAAALERNRSLFEASRAAEPST
jgi:phosphate acyltransferase